MSSLEAARAWSSYPASGSCSIPTKCSIWTTAGRCQGMRAGKLLHLPLVLDRIVRPVLLHSPQALCVPAHSQLQDFSLRRWRNHWMGAAVSWQRRPRFRVFVAGLCHRASRDRYEGQQSGCLKGPVPSMNVVGYGILSGIDPLHSRFCLTGFFDKANVRTLICLNTPPPFFSANILSVIYRWPPTM